MFKGNENKLEKVIKHSLDQTRSLASSEHYFTWEILKSGDGRTICVKTMITTGWDCRSAEWINKLEKVIKNPSLQFMFSNHAN